MHMCRLESVHALQQENFVAMQAGSHSDKLTSNAILPEDICALLDRVGILHIVNHFVRLWADDAWTAHHICRRCRHNSIHEAGIPFGGWQHVSLALLPRIPRRGEPMAIDVTTFACSRRAE